MRSFNRATAVFVIALAVVAGFGFLMRDLLHLDCVGPVIEGWGCLAVPFPTTLDEMTVTSGGVLRWVMAGVVLYAASFIFRDAIAHVVAMVMRRFFPGALRQSATSGTRPRGYRYR